MSVRDKPQYQQACDDLLRDTEAGPWTSSEGKLELFEGGGEQLPESIKRITNVLVSNHMIDLPGHIAFMRCRGPMTETLRFKGSSVHLVLVSGSGTVKNEPIKEGEVVQINCGATIKVEANLFALIYWGKSTKVQVADVPVSC